MMPSQTTINLAEPADYFPIIDDRYSTRAGLSRFGSDFGNGAQDTRLFQFDNTFKQYRDNKLACRGQFIDDYVCTDVMAASELLAASKFLLQHLCHEHADKFTLQVSSQTMQLDCHLTGEQLIINADYSLSAQENTPYKNLFDALALQVQEDICLMKIDGTVSKLVAAHLCAANHWSARDKLGMDMPSMHQQVPGFADDNREPDKLLHSISNKAEAYVRFAWGLCDHTTLNQHPNIDSVLKHQSNEKLYMRIERQVIWPIANTKILLFTIRTYFRDCAELTPPQLQSLSNAVTNMSAASLQYKRINKTGVLKRLTTLQNNNKSR